MGLGLGSNLAVRVEVGVEADGAAAGGDELDEGRDRRVRLGEEHVEKEEATEVGGARGAAVWRIRGIGPMSTLRVSEDNSTGWAGANEKDA